MKTSSHRFKAILISVTLLLTALNTLLSMELPFRIGSASELPIGIYQFQLVSYDVNDYGSKGSVKVMDKFGGFVEGLLVAGGKDFVYQTARYEYPLKRDYPGIMIFYLYLIFLTVNAVLLLMSLMLIRKKRRN